VARKAGQDETKPENQGPKKPVRPKADGATQTRPRVTHAPDRPAPMPGCGSPDRAQPSPAQATAADMAPPEPSDETRLLRNALIDLEHLRQREAAALRVTRTMFSVLDAMTQAPTLDTAIEVMIDETARAIPRSVPVLLRAKGDEILIEAAGLAALAGQRIMTGAGFVERRRILVDLQSSKFAQGLPDLSRQTIFARWQSLMLTPLEIETEEPMALGCLHDESGGFSHDDLHLLSRIAAIGAQVLEARRQASRNRHLAAVLRGDPVNDSADAATANRIDAPFEAMNIALSRMTEAQSMVLGLFNDLLQSPESEKDAAIDRALAVLGGFIGCDRTYVFRNRPPGRLDNTHEWVAEGIAPMIAALQDLDVNDFGTWLGTLRSGEIVRIDDTAELPAGTTESETLAMQGIRSLLLVPMGKGKNWRGLMGYDSVRKARNFLPGEIRILQSVASAIDTLISEREANRHIKSANAALAAERSRLVATLGAMPDLVVELGPDGTLQSYHRGQMPIVPERLNQLIGAPLTDALPPETAARAVALLAEIAKSGETRSLEFLFDLGFGPRWMEAHGARKLDDVGQLAGFVVVLRDITLSRWQSHQVARLGAIARRTTNLVFVTDADHRIDWINAACERRLGIVADRVRGLAFVDLLARYKASREDLAEIAASLRNRDPIGRELALHDPQGETLWFEIEIQPLPQEDGAAEAAMAVLVDITALKEAEARALSDRAAAMDASLDGIALVGANGRFDYMNSALRAELGIIRDQEILGRNWRHIFAQPEIARINETVMPALRQDKIWRGETIARALDGRPVELELSLTERPDGGLVVIARNITERRRVALERERLREALQIAQRREAIGHLAAGLAHDFNNLLATISGSLALIAQSSAPDAAHMPHATRIAAASDQAAMLVQRLLGFGSRAPKLGRIDLRAPLREVAEFLAPGLGARRFHLHLPKTPALADADPTDVLQIGLNLAINARDAMPSGQGDIRLRLRATTEADLAGPFDRGAPDTGKAYWLIEIEDSGHGMDDATRQTIFDPYFSTKGEGGTGLGMGIIASILTANRGAIRLDSQPGKGTRVTVLWPAVRASLSPAPFPDVDKAAPDLAGSTILLVDDSESVLAVHTAILEAAGAEVGATSLPREAIEVLRETPDAWDLVITDFDMPDLNGADFADLVHQIAPELPIMLVTALPDWQARSPQARPCFAAVLAKPVTGVRLVATAAALIATKRKA